MTKIIFPSLCAATLLLTGCAFDEPVAAQRPTASSTTITEVAPQAPRLVWPSDAPPILAASAILIDARTGRTLYQKNADQPRQVASTQKLLTALIVAEQDSLEEPVRISREDTVVEPTKLGLRVGESYSRRQLMRAMMVKSANDCAAALARSHSGSTGAFAVEMDRLASRCGATSSHFVNPHGLPARQYSTARDMARVAFRAYRNPDLREAMAMRSYCFHYANGKLCFLDPTNRLLLRSPFFNGMKTGYTESAGKCLISSYSKGGRELILVQLGSHAPRIFDDAQRMIAWAEAR
ncbi:MAG: D-alanyl-D-alanine carboxypeptidase family protein [Chthoniobacterales bacterium]|jgi:D-alanyl-D-alanine carboxypeptidase (penicillin-binding protein 5/6)